MVKRVKFLLKKSIITIIALLFVAAPFIATAADNQISDCGGDGVCIPAKDFGIGGFVCVPAAPSEDYPLVQEIPKDKQISRWIDTGFYTLGNPPNPDDPDQNDLRIVVQGGWNPWGNIPGVQYDLCKLKDCDPNDSSHGVCINKGDDVGKVVDDSDLDKLPCELFASKVGSGASGGGWGLYGLIAMNGPDNATADPNAINNATTLPPSLFRTFRISPLKKGAQVNDADTGEEKFEYYFDLKHTQKCNPEDGCVHDKYQGAGSDYIVRGKLYFKILDSYYQDNSGSYTINIIKGIYTPKGFIESTINSFQEKIISIINDLTNNVVKNSGFLGLVRALILLYVTFTGVMFMMGMVEMNQKELLIRCFKVIIVSVLLSERSWDLFTQEVFGAFQSTIVALGDIIIKATLYYDNGMPVYQMPETSTPLSVYDLMLNMITRTPVHAKALSTLFYKWKLYWIPAIYICIAFILISILKSVMFYLIMFMQMGILLLVAPIFLVTLLFKITDDLFQGWWKQIVSTGILYILLSVSIALMMKLVVGQLQELLSYRVCWQSVWKLKIFGLTLWDLKFWYPSYDGEVSSALNGVNFLKFLVVSTLFFGLMNEIPKLADVLSGSARFATDNMISSVNSSGIGIFNYVTNNAIGMANMANPVGWLIHDNAGDKVDKLNRLGRRFNTLRDQLRKRGPIALITPADKKPRGIKEALKEDWKPIAKSIFSSSGSDGSPGGRGPGGGPVSPNEGVSSSAPERGGHTSNDSRSGSQKSPSQPTGQGQDYRSADRRGAQSAQRDSGGLGGSNDDGGTRNR